MALSPSQLDDREFPNDPKDQIGAIARMRDEGTKWRDSWGQRWDQNVAVVRGELWPDKATKPQFLANLISPAVRRKAGLLCESKPGIDIRPRRNGLQLTADVLRKTATALLAEQDFSNVLESISYFLTAFGCGFIKVSYDPDDDYGLGSVTIDPVDPRLMLIDPNVVRAAKFHCCSYVIETSVVDWWWIKKRFPKTYHDVEPNFQIPLETNDTHKVSWYEGMVDRMRKRSSSSDSAVPRVYLQQVWAADHRTDKSGNLIYPGGRRIFITGDDVILNPSTDPRDPDYGQANPHWDGLWPYVMLDNEPDLDHPFGHSEVESLRKLNEAFNSVGHNVVKTLVKNIAWVIADRSSIETETIQDLKSLEEMVIEKAPGRNVERVAPTQPTTTNIQFMQLVQGLIDLSSGLADGGQAAGKGRTEIRSGAQLEGLQQAAQILIRAQARRLESAIERTGTLLTSRIFQYMTDDRIMIYVDGETIKQFDFQKAQLSQELKKLAEEEADEEARVATEENLSEGLSLDKAIVQPSYTPERIQEKTRGAWKLFRFKVLPFSTLSATKVQRAAVLEQLAEQLAIPQSMVTQEAGFDNWEELQQQAVVEQAKKQQLLQQLGIQPPEPKKKASPKR